MKNTKLRAQIDISRIPMDEVCQNSFNKTISGNILIWRIKNINCKLNGLKMTFSAQWGPLCEIFCFGGPKLCFSVKQWTISVPSPFQRFKMLFKFKKDQSCKNFTIWAKIVKVAKKKGYNRENWNFRDLNCFHWKICWKILISIIFGVKMSRKLI